jgi:hypothetical protein
MRDSHRRGMIGWAAALGTLIHCILPAAATADMLDELRGVWAATPSGPPSLEWASSDGGFSVSWTPPDAGPTTIHFVEAGRPDVYAGTAKEGWSMMGAMFGEDGPVNPIEGGTLYWARKGEDGVYLYSLTIDDGGGFQIDRYRCRPAERSLIVSFQRRTADGAGEPTEQRLVRVGQ